MISKGKEGVSFDLGVPLCILEDQHQFILGFNIMWEGINAEAIKPLVDQVIESFPTLDTLSTDKGFWSPEVYAYLSSKLELAAIPKKGRIDRGGGHAHNQSIPVLNRPLTGFNIVD